MVGREAPPTDTTAVTGVSTGIDDDPPSCRQGCGVDTTDGKRRRRLAAETVEHTQHGPLTAQTGPPGVVRIDGKDRKRNYVCSLCKSMDTIQFISVPFVFKYLLVELAAMNIRIDLQVKEA